MGGNHILKVLIHFYGVGIYALILRLKNQYISNMQI